MLGSGQAFRPSSRWSGRPGPVLPISVTKRLNLPWQPTIAGSASDAKDRKLVSSMYQATVLASSCAQVHTCVVKDTRFVMPQVVIAVDVSI